MLIIFKNKGILTPVYLFASIIGTAILYGELIRYIKETSECDYNLKILLGFGFLIAGLWTYLTREDFVKRDGVKIKVDIENSLFFISMKTWAYIFMGVGILFLLLALISFIFGIKIL